VTILTPHQISTLLNKSIKWVYSNASSLGAVRIGGSWIFTEEGLNDAIKGAGYLDRPGHGARPIMHKTRLSNQDRGQRLGSIKAARTTQQSYIAEARSLGIID